MVRTVPRLASVSLVVPPRALALAVFVLLCGATAA